MLPLDRLDGMTVFLAVADRGNFAAAGAQLGLSRSAISLTVRKLEGRLGVVLFTRTTRNVGLTEAGQRLFERARPLLVDLDACLSEVADLGDGPSGRLRISIPRIAVPLVIEPILAEFAQVAPRVTLELVANDGLVDVARDGYDAGIRLGDQVDADMIGVDLTGPLPWQIVASPAYLAARGTPGTPEDLAHHSCIEYRYSSSPGTYRWELIRDGRLVPFAVRGSVVVNDYATKQAVARQGLGLAYDLVSTFEDDVRDGRLVPVLAAYAQTTPGLFLYYPARHQVMPKLRALVEICRRHARSRGRSTRAAQPENPPS